MKIKSPMFLGLLALTAGSFCGCDGDGLSTAGDVDAGPAADAGEADEGRTTDDTDGDVVTAEQPDLARALGQTGDHCASVCDCADGLDCVRGACAMGGMRMIYCCESATCPMDQVCQSAAGRLGRCGVTVAGRPDGGPSMGGNRPDGGRTMPGRPDGGRFGGPTDGGPFGGRPDGGRMMGGRPDGGRFGGRPDGGPTMVVPMTDGGVPTACASVPCQGDQICQEVKCGSCDLTTNRCQ